MQGFQGHRSRQTYRGVMARRTGRRTRKWYGRTTRISMGLGTASGLRKPVPESGAVGFSLSAVLLQRSLRRGTGRQRLLVFWEHASSAIATLDDQDMAFAACGHDLFLCCFRINFSTFKISLFLTWGTQVPFLSYFSCLDGLSFTIWTLVK